MPALSDVVISIGGDTTRLINGFIVVEVYIKALMLKARVPTERRAAAPATARPRVGNGEAVSISGVSAPSPVIKRSMRKSSAAVRAILMHEPA